MGKKENKHEIWHLQQMQSLPLESKVRMTKDRIRGWYEHFDGKIYVSFSGGKDSTVLLHIAREVEADIKAVFVNTGLEYPAVRLFAQNQENTETIYPEMKFKEVLCEYGYPIISKEVSECVAGARKHLEANGKYEYSYNKLMGIGEYEATPTRTKKLLGTLKDKDGNKSKYNCSKYMFLLNAPFKISNQCCNKTKKDPAHRYSKKTGEQPITGQMANESRLRKQAWLKNGCNGFDMEMPISNPLSFWTEQDILEYIVTRKLDIAKTYGEVVAEKNKLTTTKAKRTGCIFCLFGIMQDLDRIAKLQIEEPQLADYVLKGGMFADNGMWQPSNVGLGYWFVIEWLNIHGLGIEYYKDVDYVGIYGDERTRKILLQEKIKAKIKKARD